MSSLATLLLLAAPAVVQSEVEALERLPFQVREVRGLLVVIDRGARHGLARGDTVVLRRAGAPPWVGVVRDARDSSATVELDGDEESTPPVGARGEVLVPRERLAELDAPEHPPWQEPVGPWAPGKPLLAPARSPEPEERPSDLRGRVSAYGQYTDDAQYARRTSRVRLSTSFDWDNPFARGGALRFKGDVSFRDLSSGTASDDTILRLARLSYRLGGRPEDDYGVEFGRFLSSLFPQFGLLDGVEVVRRLEGGDQLGASLGFLPDYVDDLAATDDVSAALFYRWVEGPEERVALALGYQKTWHKGAADRDLLVGTARWIAGPRTTLSSSVLVDYYDGTAQLESHGFELTEAHATLTRRLGDAAGVNLYGSYLDWPELLKTDFPTPPPATISDQKVARAGVSGYAPVGEATRLNARLEAWSDDQNSGHLVDLRVDVRDALAESSQLSLGAFLTSGAFSEGLGGRARQTFWFGPSTLRLGYELVQYTQDGFLGDQEQLLQHLASLGFDTRLDRDTDLSLTADQRFGDEVDALTLTLRLTWRF